MIELLIYTIIPWAFLNSVCGLLGSIILSNFNRRNMGVVLGMLLGPIGLIIVVLICQWERERTHGVRLD